MYQTITQSDFISTFKQIRPESFSLAALESLFEFIEELEDDTGEQSEFDPIALCCDWAEYSLDELKREYSGTVEELAECDDIVDARDIMADETVALLTRDDTLLVLAF